MLVEARHGWSLNFCFNPLRIEWTRGSSNLIYKDLVRSSMFHDSHRNWLGCPTSFSQKGFLHGHPSFDAGDGLSRTRDGEVWTRSLEPECPGGVGVGPE